MKNKLYIVGIGSGDRKSLTLKAIEVIQTCDMIVGYKRYIQYIEDLIEDQEIFSTGMKKEIERCTKALECAREGKKVAMISSGDAGVYGMAGPILQLKAEKFPDVDVEVIPGITAMNLGAAALGAPLMHDTAIISLSNLLTPWETIEKRLEHAAAGDFVIALYNPRSNGRPHLLKRARDIIAKHKQLNTPVGIVKHAGREKEELFLSTLKDFNDEWVDMNSIVIIGNSCSFISNNLFITPRGYHI
ncbi:precorrin-3B C(17)-methyltransferase [Vallitalea okinawensis]|uniref:precorrin-3B C(17)-methyltransferase n=1 Tax=Vallitalea okinawensis TaxID=2078660 RepID=UPI000CFACDE3|nr:precorrin-3B C(17)-methyltransferase [Vallitalea okinawensis]